MQTGNAPGDERMGQRHRGVCKPGDVNRLLRFVGLASQQRTQEQDTNMTGG